MAPKGASVSKDGHDRGAVALRHPSRRSRAVVRELLGMRFELAESGSDAGDAPRVAQRGKPRERITPIDAVMHQ